MTTVRPHFTYLGHSTILCELPQGERILIDPWVMNNPSCPEALHELERLDAILITHAHFDHMGDAVALAKKYQPKKIVASFEICTWLKAQGVENLSAMHLGGAQQVLGWEVAMVRADHSSSLMDNGLLLHGGPAAGYMVRCESGFRFYHAGDTALFSDMKLLAELYEPQLAFLPIGDLFTMDPRQAALACAFLSVSEVIPIHWGTFPLLTGTPTMLAGELSKRGIECAVVTLEPGAHH